MKKTISIMLSIMLILSAFNVVSASNNGSLTNFKKTQTYSNQFTDVSESSWYCDSVKKVYEYAFMNGNSDTTFNPTGNILLSEVMAIVARLNSIYYNGNANFETSTPWYQSYVDYNKENSIIEKYGYYKFSEKATREEFAYFIAKSLPESVFTEINSIEDNAVIDYPMDGEYSKEIYSLYRAGIISGSDEKGTFNPNSNITRAEVATILTRIINPDSRVKFSLRYEISEYYDGYPLKTVTAVTGVSCDSSHVDNNSVKGYVSGYKKYGYSSSAREAYFEYLNSNPDITLYDQSSTNTINDTIYKLQTNYFYKLSNGQKFTVVTVSSIKPVVTGSLWIIFD